MNTTIKLSGNVNEWNVSKDEKNVRRYIQLTLPYKTFSQYFKPELYNHKDGKGEQRAIVESHKNKLVKAILDFSYTPTTMSASLRERHRKNLTIENGIATIEVNSGDPLPLTDGGHRCAAIQQIVEKGDEQLSELANNLPISFLLLLDGVPQRDFINLQAGKGIDASHMFSLKLKCGMLDKNIAPLFKTAESIASKLNKMNSSPFKNHIAFDSRSQASLKITTICANGASDQATSLIGMAKIAESFSYPTKDLAEYVTKVQEKLQNDCPELLEAGKALTPFPEGTKGSATMLIGLSNVLLYRVLVLKQNEPTDKDLNKLIKAAKNSLNVEINGGFPAQMKRKLMGEFASEFLEDIKDEKHSGVPVTLLNIFSPSAFGLPAMK